ncbi:MAG: Rid family hydrolase [Acidimicrobiales bacterium]
MKSSPVPSGAYSQGIVAGGLLFVAGVGPYDPVTRAIVGSTVEEQTVQTIENIRAILIGAGLALQDVVNSTVYLSDMSRDWFAFDKTYRQFFSPPFPARTAVGATLKGILVEIAVMAALRPTKQAGGHND